MKKRILILTMVLTTGCATVPRYEGVQMDPRPEMRDRINRELRRIVPEERAKVTDCHSRPSDPNHYVCEGDFGFESPREIREIFAEAVREIHEPDLRIDFLAEERTDVTIVKIAAVVLVIFIVAAIAKHNSSGSGTNHFPIYSGDRPSDPDEHQVRFSVHSGS